MTKEQYERMWFLAAKEEISYQEQKEYEELQKIYKTSNYRD